MVHSISLRTLILLGILVVVGVATGAWHADHVALHTAEKNAYAAWASNSCYMSPDPHCMTAPEPPLWIIKNAFSF